MHKGMQEIESEEREESSQYANIATAGLIARPRGPRATRIGITKDSTADGNHVNLNHSPLVFRLYPATGGHIVEYSFYDERKDQNTQALHLIPSDADLGDALSKIMTLEALRR